MSPPDEPTTGRVWSAGTSKEFVLVYDVRFTNLVRRVRADSTAAQALPHSRPEP